MLVPVASGAANPRKEREGRMKKEWRFLSFRWWVIHFCGVALVYAAGRLASLYFAG
jgi:hypothetical protein